jgi:hypothetical protein
MTPRDLREIANAMEAKWTIDIWGKSTDTKEWYIDKQTTVVFSLDQERMRQQIGEPRDV